MYGRKYGKKNYEEMMVKLAKIFRKIILFCLGDFGSLFLIIGLILEIFVSEENYFICLMSLIFFALAILIYFLIPTKYSYEKYKEKQKKFGYCNIYQLSSEFNILKEKNEQLEK